MCSYLMSSARQQFNLGKAEFAVEVKNFIFCLDFFWTLNFIFETDAGILNYLNGKEFEVNDVWFAKNGKINSDR